MREVAAARAALLRPLSPSRRAEARKKRSIGEPGGNGESPSKPIVCGPPSTLTRTEITAGFTFSTMSAKPTGRCAFCA